MRKIWILIIFMILSCSSNKEDLMKEYGLGKIEYAKGNLEGSKKHFTKISKEDDGYEDVPLYLAKIEYYQGHFENASTLFSNLLDDDVYGYQAHLLKFKSDYAYRKDRAQLLKEIGDALKKDSSNLDLLILSAKLHEELGQISQSILYYQRILNESDKILLAHKELRKIYQKAGIVDQVEFHSRKIEYWKDERTNTKQEKKQ